MLFDEAMVYMKKLEEACSDEFRDYLPKKCLLKMAERMAHWLSELGDIEFICNGGNLKFTLPELKTMLLYIKTEAKKKNSAGDTKEGGILLLRVFRGLPKNKNLIKKNIQILT